MFLTPLQCRTGVAALVMLAGGCGENAPPGPEQVKRQAASLPQPLPGRYRSETRLVQLDLPGTGKEDARLLQQRMSAVQPQVRMLCLTMAEAQQGFAPLVRQMQQGACTVSRFDTTGGRLDAEMICPLDGGGTSRIALSGTAQQRESTLDMRITQSAPSIPGGRMVLDMEVRNRWIGTC